MLFQADMRIHSRLELNHAFGHNVKPQAIDTRYVVEFPMHAVVYGQNLAVEIYHVMVLPTASNPWKQGWKLLEVLEWRAIWVHAMAKFVHVFLQGRLFCGVFVTKEREKVCRSSVNVK